MFAIFAWICIYIAFFKNMNPISYYFVAFVKTDFSKACFHFETELFLIHVEAVSQSDIEIIIDHLCINWRDTWLHICFIKKKKNKAWEIKYVGIFYTDLHQSKDRRKTVMFLQISGN